jgi:hypothetical protein
MWPIAGHPFLSHATAPPAEINLFRDATPWPLPQGMVRPQKSCRKETNTQSTEQSLNQGPISDSGRVCSPLNPSIKERPCHCPIIIASARK